MTGTMVFVVAACVLAGIAVLHWMCRDTSPRINTLKGKHVVITGGSSGIGLAMAKEVVAQGGFVTLISRNAANLQSAVERLLEDVSFHADSICSKVGDVSNYQAISKAIQEAFEWKPIDVVICNAGLTRGGSFENQTVEDMDITIRTNLNGTVYPIHAALPLIKKHSKKHPVSIVLVGSLASMYMFYGQSVYTATKYAVKGFAESLRYELLASNIHVSLACPGFVATPFLDEVDKDEENTKLLKTLNMYDRKGAENPSEVAKRILEGAKKGTYLITNDNFPGLLLSTIARGFVPAETVGQFLVEMMLYLPFRVFSVRVQADARKALLQHVNRSK